MNYITGSNGMIGTRFKQLSLGVGKCISYRDNVPDNLLDVIPINLLINIY